ncbi:exopolyphosphatase [Lichenihabitans sp. Uapishka_5]|uniref:exopolyphosphatase n=1 Tax=Lichenihabitans sp. Uapishka_5 TaxID=3037302 RepID=UPI0029E7EA00|nr:exopolyphosphatase [Lichenihabitans sp. Uapishka_5]MDX7949648.1 exopolyphosphatase [Lichenihabitans sp. Uapishka_5]
MPSTAASAAAAPLAIVDIGSNSVRLVAYEALTRAPTPLFNEKVLCGLGKGVATTGLLAPEAADKALAALRTFRALCRNMGIDDITVVATAATRDARNGAAFLEAAQDAIGVPAQLIGGAREAELAALGVASSFHKPDGIVGDLGGGSLELIELRKAKLRKGVSLPIGGLALSDLSKGSPKRALKIARDALKAAGPLDALRGRTFYAVGGTWRALARLHMHQRNYPLDVMHGYVIPGDEAEAFARLVERVDTNMLTAIGSVSAARRPLLSYGAVVLDEIIHQGRPRAIVVSAAGVREGLLFERLSTKRRDADPLIEAVEHYDALRARSPGHGHDLCGWTDAFMASADLDESEDERRLRHAACLLSDISWRAHPDYRAAQSLNIIANANLIGIDHAGRAFLALACAYRHANADDDGNASLRSLVSPRLLDRARILAAAMRIAFIMTAGQAGVLRRFPLACTRAAVSLTVAPAEADLVSDRVMNRLRQLARLIGREGAVLILK